MNSKIIELIEILEVLINLLDENNQEHWLNTLKQAKLRVLNSDFSGVEMLLGIYGGMGSFSDLIFQPPIHSGKIQFSNKQIDDNEKLELYRSKAWDLAVILRHEFRDT